MTGIERIKKTFALYPKVFMGYLMAGDGGMDRTFEAATALIKGGVNLLEIGVPFSDPVADGPVIQAAAMRALASGVCLESILQLVQRIRSQSDIPLILFTYLNPLLSALQDPAFLWKAKQSGVDGILIVDCPFDLLDDLRKSFHGQGIALIDVITPVTPLSRIQEIDQITQGFLYYACRKGITGIKKEFPADFAESMQKIRQIVRHPIVVGFGISNRQMASQALEYAEGVVIGSLFVKALEQHASPEILTVIMQDILSD